MRCLRAYAALALCIWTAAASSSGAQVAMAAQSGPGGPCTFIADAAIAPANAIQSVNAPGLESCVVQDGAADPITIFHITGPIDASDIAGPGQVPGALPPIEKTPVDGIGDSALLLRFTVDDETLVSLRVQTGDDVYAFTTSDTPETPDRLVSLAKAVLGATATSI